MELLLRDDMLGRQNDSEFKDVGDTIVVVIVDMNSWQLETGMVVVNVFNRLVSTSCL